MGLVSGLSELIGTLTSAGPIGIGIATAFVACIAALILSSRVREMLVGTRVVEQGAQFQGSLLELLKMMREDEVRMRARIAELEASNGDLRDDLMEIKATLALIRNQRRRLLRILREALADGRIHHASVDGTDLVVRT